MRERKESGEMTEFSLITVCFHPGEKLRKTLESALRQTYGNFELIVKDGGSRDGSLEAVPDLLADPRVRVFVEKDTGIYDAMNIAVSEARGDWTAFMNAGDEYFSDHVFKDIFEIVKFF